MKQVKFNKPIFEKRKRKYDLEITETGIIKECYSSITLQDNDKLERVYKDSHNRTFKGNVGTLATGNLKNPNLFKDFINTDSLKLMSPIQIFQEAALRSGCEALFLNVLNDIGFNKLKDLMNLKALEILPMKYFEETWKCSRTSYTNLEGWIYVFSGGEGFTNLATKWQKQKGAIRIKTDAKALSSMHEQRALRQALPKNDPNKYPFKASIYVKYIDEKIKVILDEEAIRNEDGTFDYNLKRVKARLVELRDHNLLQDNYAKELVELVIEYYKTDRR